MSTLFVLETFEGKFLFQNDPKSFLISCRLEGLAMMFLREEEMGKYH